MSYHMVAEEEEAPRAEFYVEVRVAKSTNTDIYACMRLVANLSALAFVHLFLSSPRPKRPASSSSKAT